MKPRQTLLKLTTWGGLATGLLSATAVLSASLGSFFEPSDDPTAQSWCYTWTLVNTTPEVADGLRLTVEGPKDVARFYEGPANPFGKPVSHGLTPLGYEVHFQGGAVEPGREVQVGLCTRSRVAQPGGAEDRPAYEWTLGGKPLPGQEQPTAPGQAWGYEGEGEGPFRPYVTLTNPGRVALHVYQLEWARTDRAFPPEQIDWEQLDGSVQWMPLEAERVVPAAPSPEESGTLFARLPLETQPDDASLVLVRAWLQPEDGREPVRLVSQVQLAALFVPEKISEASTVRWSALTFPADKVQPGLRDRLKAAGTLPFLVFLPRQADLSQVAGIQDWNERGQQVLQQLRATAEESQGSLRGFLADQQKLGRVEGFETFYIVNAVAVTGGSEALETLVRREDVAYVEALDTFYLPEPVSSEPTGGVSAQSAWDSVGRVGAPAVWSQFGLNGAGVVVANIDTGVQWNHPSLMNQYRGTATGSHNFNWFDATTYNPNNPSSPSYRQVPYDNNGHGTHTIGTIAGSGGIGVAPGARWIAARVGDRSLPAVNLLRAGEWILAPFAPAAGLGPDSSRRPHVVNNSWGGPGGSLWYQGIISNWRAAGILPVFSAGNSGSRRRTLGSPRGLRRELHRGGDQQRRQHCRLQQPRPLHAHRGDEAGRGGPGCLHPLGLARQHLPAAGRHLHGRPARGRLRRPHVPGLAPLPLVPGAARELHDPDRGGPRQLRAGRALRLRPAQLLRRRAAGRRLRPQPALHGAGRGLGGPGRGPGHGPDRRQPAAGRGDDGL